MDEKSTPIANLNNRSDDSEVVNEILNKYNNLQNAPLQAPPQQTDLEESFENRNLNNEMYNANMDNTSYKQHYEGEVQRVKTQQYQQQPQQQMMQQPQDGNDDDNEYEEYEEYEMVELPLWKRVVNDLRIPLIIFVLILFFFNPMFDKFLVSKVPYLGNQYNEANTYGFLFKALLVAVLSYILIKFVKL